MRKNMSRAAPFFFVSFAASRQTRSYLLLSLFNKITSFTAFRETESPAAGLVARDAISCLA
jgi:hypothetical protein